MNKEEKYQKLLKQIPSIFEGEENLIANMANFCAMIKEEFNFLWIGFYLVDEVKNQLVLGPFQGPLACTRIPYGKGVCGTSWSEEKTLCIDDVHKFEGHIACSSLSNSEIVIPLRKNGKVFGVLDIDSTEFSTFDEVDSKYLEELVAFL